MGRGFAAASAESPAGPGGGVAAGRRGVVAVGSAAGAAPPDICSARQSAKRPMSFALTSCITPRPNCAAGPVTRMSVSTFTRVPPSTSSIVEVIVAAALPCPRLSRACARMTALRPASSASSILTVPLYFAVIGPILIVIVPWCSSPSAPSIAAPGRHGATRSTSSSTAHACSTGAGTVNSFSSFIASRRTLARGPRGRPGSPRP